MYECDSVHACLVHALCARACACPGELSVGKEWLCLLAPHSSKRKSRVKTKCYCCGVRNNSFSKRCLSAGPVLALNHMASLTSKNSCTDGEDSHLQEGQEMNEMRVIGQGVTGLHVDSLLTINPSLPVLPSQ